MSRSFQQRLTEFLQILEEWLSDPEDSVQQEEWMASAEWIAYAYEFSEVEQDYVDYLLDMFREQHEAQRAQRAQRAPITLPSHTQLDELLGRKQLEQRTPEWYAQMSTIISASELGSLFAAPRQRATLVVSKTVPPVPRQQPLAVPSDHMRAFDWGIRFEPVVKQIYEWKYGVTMKELGRLHHPTDPRCTASPDGLIYDCPKNERRGRLIEIKCPVTRQITGMIPKDYYAQMQMQLHVTELDICDYVEASFSSPYPRIERQEGPSQFDGYIALVRYAESRGTQDFYYIYSPIQAEADWKPEHAEDEEIVEIIPWRLMQWSEQQVMRSEEWWRSLQPFIETFWEDVEKAKRGEFTIPDSTRIAKRALDPCQIVFHREDASNTVLQGSATSAKEEPCNTVSAPSASVEETSDMKIVFLR
jgi:hypothetical protein